MASNDYSCKGLFLRCRINNYVSGGKIEFKTTFTMLKRKSCDGSCVIGHKGWMCSVEYFLMALREGGIEDLTVPEDIEDSAIYKLCLMSCIDDGEVEEYRLLRWKELEKK